MIYTIGESCEAESCGGPGGVGDWEEEVGKVGIWIFKYDRQTRLKPF